VGKDVGAAPGPVLHAAWIDLRNEREGHAWSLAVFARFPVTFGRAPAGAVDMPLRVYPVAQNRDQCMKVSSKHGQVDRTPNGWSITDLKSHNGISVNGKMAPPQKALALPRYADVAVSSEMALNCMTLARTLPPESQVNGDKHEAAASPALVIYRTQNRKELVYALLADRLPVGGDPTSALVLPGLPERECGALWRLKDRFWWQSAERDASGGAADLTPLYDGSRWKTGGITFTFMPLAGEMFD
jgi:hypothetical protein